MCVVLPLARETCWAEKVFSHTILHALGGVWGLGGAGSCALVALQLGDVSVDVLQVGTVVELFWLPRQLRSGSHRCYPKSFPVHPDRKETLCSTAPSHALNQWYETWGTRKHLTGYIKLEGRDIVA
jgi:hypothetical protein